MKKLIILLLAFLTFSAYGQAEFEKIAITENVETASTSKIVSQQPGTGELNYINATALPISNAVKDSILKKVNLPTGFTAGLVLSINADPTKFDISAGSYAVTDFTDLTKPIVKIISFPGATGITPNYLATANATYIELDINGNIIQSSSPFSNSDRRTKCLVGSVIHSNRTIINLTNEIKAPIIASTNQLHDLIKAIGAFNIKGNVYGQNGANLQINKTAGDVFALGINAQDYTNPHVLTLAEQTGLTFRYRTQTGIEGTDTNAINPNLYDVAGVATAVPVNKWTVQRFNLFQTNATRVQYGQNIYNSYAEALSGFPTANFVTEQNIAENSIFRSYLIVKQGTTDLAAAVAAGTAKFIAVDKFGNVISGGSIALTYANVIAALGYTPENIANKQNSLLVDGTGQKYPTVDAVNGGLASKADKQGTILYHSVRWFTPSSTVSNVGATVTSIGTQFTSGMVGSILRINNEDRLIITYTSSTVVVVESAYSTNYSGVVAGSWGVYSKGFEIESDGKINVKNTGEDSAVLGTELLLNNSFNTDLSSWIVGANWSYSSGGALHTTGSVETLSQNVSLISGNTYLISVTMSGRTTGDLVFQLGALDYAFSFNDSGRFNLTEYKTVVATATGSFPITLTPGTTFNGKVDEVSIKLVNRNTVGSTLNLLNKLDVLSSEIRANSDLKNIFFGLNSGESNATGIENIAFGNGVLKDNTTGYQNTAFGYESMRYNTTGFSNTAYGYSSFLRNKNGSRNTAIGVYSMLENTIGKNNTALGTHSMQSSTTGSDNVAIGMSSMMIGANTGSYNTGINTLSLYRNTTGSYNIGVGFQTLFNNTTGSNNIALGLQALNLNITGSSNIAIGSSSLISSTGVRNTAIGTDAGRSITTGTYNTHIGSAAGFDASQLVSATNSTAIGNGSYNTASNQVVIGNSSVTQTILRGNVETNGTISMSPATLSNQGVVKSQLDLKANQDGTILYHTAKWFTPSSTVSNVGATVTSVGTQFTSAMVGAKLIINGEQRIITTYTSSTVVVVDSAYSTNYSGVDAGSWGVFSKGIELLSNGRTNFILGTQDGGASAGSKMLEFEEGLLKTTYGMYANNSNAFYGGSAYFSTTQGIRWANSSQALPFGTNDLGLRRNSAGVLEIYDGITATGLEANRRDLILRNLTMSTPTTSAGTYDILTRNSSTGAVEKVANNLLSGVLLLDKTSSIYNATTTGRKTIKTWVIPANTIPADCMLRITLKTTRLLGSGNPFMSLSINGSNGWLNGQNGNTARRHIVINDTTYDFHNSSGTATDDIISPLAYSTFPINRTINNTLTLEMDCDVTGDIFKFDFIMIEIIK